MGIMKNLRRMTMLAFCLSWAYAAAEMPEFVEHIIFQPAGSWGKTGYGDFDNDGKLDLTAGPARGAVYWFRNPGDFTQEWTRFEIDPKNGGCVGGEPADVDGDGLVDFLSHGMWYRNNKENPGENFEKFSFSTGVITTWDGCHDVVAVDINGDGLIDAMNHEVNWWKNPGKEKVTELWESHAVAKSGYHGGIAPHGFGDIDGDGDTDVAGIGEWFKNVTGDGTQWEKIEYSSWSGSNENRVWVADYDGDGDQDIAVAEGDGSNGKAAWFRNLDGKGGDWETNEFPLDGLTGDLHSVGGQDFDRDGDLDVFVGQNRKKDQNEWVIFENTDGKGAFEKRVIYKGYGAHESIYADFDADGDIDIFSKCWCGDGAGVILENKLDPVGVDDRPFQQTLKEQLSFNARIAGSGRGARLLVSSQAPGPNTLELFDLQGNKFVTLHNMGSADNTISLQDLNEGVVIIRLNTQNGAIAEKIVFKR
jgi:hypothetical protein